VSVSLLRAAVDEARLVGVALQFLTRVPVPVRHFPLVGAMVGACAGAVVWSAGTWWPAGIAALLSMAATAWLTGAFHEDGLADTCDGLGGAVTRERALEIMKDSRLGSYGALGLGLTLALKAAALMALLQLSPAYAAAASVLAHTVSRAASVTVMAVLPYAGDVAQAKAQPLAQPARWNVPVVAAAWALAVACGTVVSAQLPVLGCAIAVLLAGAVAARCATWFKRRLGGWTGDTLGAVQQWSELAVYLALAGGHLVG
jgi:adenosylcobinamide-GDP ribazoletransferase